MRAVVGKGGLAVAGVVETRDVAVVRRSGAPPTDGQIGCRSDDPAMAVRRCLA